MNAGFDAPSSINCNKVESKLPNCRKRTRRVYWPRAQSEKQPIHILIGLSSGSGRGQPKVGSLVSVRKKVVVDRE